MKICIVTHKIVKGDGQGRVNYEVAWEAIRRGHQLTLLASSVSPDLLQNNLVNWIPISVAGWPTALLKNLIFSWKSSTWLNQHRAEVDVVKVNGAITSFPSDVNAVHFVHSAWLRSPFHPWQQARTLHSFYQWLYNWLNSHWEKQAFHRTTQLVAVSETIKRELIDIGIQQESIVVIENGVDLQEFFPGSSDRASWSFPQNVALALFVGDLHTNRKNLDTILYALQHVPELHLAVLGDTVGSPYPKLAEDLGLAQRVHFLGYRQDVAAIMRAVDFFVFPSRYEPFGMVISEAMASGLPVVTAQTVGAAHLVSSDCGFVVPYPDDVNAIAEAMRSLAGNLQLLQQFGRNARIVAEQSNWSGVASCYVDLFEKLGYSSPNTLTSQMVAPPG
jgi:glycosyltransferase involved in cell wall biosynthesis